MVRPPGMEPIHLAAPASDYRSRSEFSARAVLGGTALAFFRRRLSQKDRTTALLRACRDARARWLLLREQC